jgi:hypothetical protein
LPCFRAGPAGLRPSPPPVPPKRGEIPGLFGFRAKLRLRGASAKVRVFVGTLELVRSGTLYAFNALRWALDRKIADVCYWLSAFAITTAVTFPHKH